MNAQVIMNCPACNAPVEPEDNLEIGESLECDQCEALLVVVGIDPHVIDLDEEEDDDDEGDVLDEDEDDLDPLEDDADDIAFEEEDDEEED